LSLASLSSDSHVSSSGGEPHLKAKCEIEEEKKEELPKRPESPKFAEVKAGDSPISFRRVVPPVQNQDLQVSPTFEMKEIIQRLSLM